MINLWIFFDERKPVCFIA